FRSLEEIKNTIRLPLLGTCPYNKNLAVLFPGNHKKARKKGLISPQTLSEAFNLTLDSYCHLYTNISLLSADKPINSIVISATFPQEGKTSTAVGLAKAAAMMGKKVLLVDTDMRVPSVHSYFGLDNQTGLSQLVTDNITLEEVIKSCPQQENLFVITAGTMPPNPIPLLASNKWHSFMEQFYQQFDFVIYDSPPLTVFPDAKTIAPQTDGLVLVLGMGLARRPVVQQVLNDLQVSRITVLGLVVNGLKRDFNHSYGHAYGYRYGYGYGYGSSAQVQQ
ncbi:MAG: CpsD/CapB family tyrosine-protein kinase, partial [Geminocystis sp.]|nr:CpsD/CapB family tyrosine-protein kinase [Geminocystis sp.]